MGSRGEVTVAPTHDIELPLAFEQHDVADAELVRW
jgi:hypothetical protein